MWKKLLVTLDGSKRSEAILPIVREAAAPGVEVILLTVAETPSAVLAEDVHPLVAVGAPAAGGVASIPAARIAESRDQAIQRIVAETKDYLEGHAKALRVGGLKVKTEVVFGDPVEEIVSAAKAQSADAIAMATHGRTGLAEVMLGSVSSKVIAKGRKPVLAVRPAGLK